MASPEEILARQIRKTYTQAAREVKEKLSAFTAAHEKKSAELLQQVKDGTITEADYKAWLQGQVFIGQRWQQKLKDITQVYVDADEKARQLVGGTMQNVFVDFANETARDIQGTFRNAVSFDMYDKNTVQRLLKDDPDMLPEWKIDEPKDYRWNRQRVQNTVTQGIIQGESVDKIGARLASELAAKNANKMTMFARTAITGAQNAGRIDRLHEAQQMGIKVRKKWLAFLDDRTRDAHRDLNGVEVDVDEPFTVIGDDGITYEIDYPGDPHADPAMVYNCRCTLIYVYPDYQGSLETVEQQEEMQTEPENNTEEIRQLHGGEAVEGIENEQNRKAVTERLEAAPDFIRGAWESAADEMHAPQFDLKGKKYQSQAYFNPSDGRTHYTDEAKCFGRSSYQEECAVYFHEYGHNVDYVLAEGEHNYLSNEYMDGAFGKSLRSEIDGTMQDFYCRTHADDLFVQIKDANDFDTLRLWNGQPGGVPLDREYGRVLRRMEREGAIDTETRLSILQRASDAMESGDMGTLERIFTEYLSEDKELRDEIDYARTTANANVARRAMRKESAAEFCRVMTDHYSIYELSDISDMFDAVFSVENGLEYGMGVGHGKDYFSSGFRGSDPLALEAFAEMFSATATNNKSLPLIRQFFPKSYEMFCDMVRSAVK